MLCIPSKRGDKGEAAEAGKEKQICGIVSLYQYSTYCTERLQPQGRKTAMEKEGSTLILQMRRGDHMVVRMRRTCGGSYVNKGWPAVEICSLPLPTPLTSRLVPPR